MDLKNLISELRSYPAHYTAAHIAADAIQMLEEDRRRFKTLKREVGQKFFFVRKKINLSSQKTVMVDAAGVQWFRYIEPKVEFRILEAEIIGRIQYRVDGEHAWDEEARYAVRFENGEVEEVYEDSFDDHDDPYDVFFETREEAEAFVAKRLSEIG